MKQTTQPNVPKPSSPSFTCPYCPKSCKTKHNLKIHLYSCTSKPAPARSSKRPQRNVKQPVILGSALDSSYTMEVHGKWKPSLKTGLSTVEKKQVQRQAQHHEYELNELVWVKNGKHKDGSDHWYRARVVDVHTSTSTYDVIPVFSSNDEEVFKECHVVRSKLLSAEMYRKLFPMKTTTTVPSMNVEPSYEGQRAYDMRFHTVDGFLSLDKHKKLIDFASYIVKKTLLENPEFLSLHAGTGSWSGCGKSTGPIKLHYSRPIPKDPTADYPCGDPPHLCVGCSNINNPNYSAQATKRQKSSTKCDGCSDCLGREFHCNGCNNVFEIAAEYAAKSGRSSVGEDIYCRRIQAFNSFLESLCQTIETYLRIPIGTLNHCTIIIYTGGALCIKNWDQDDTCPDHLTGDDECGRVLAEHCDSLLNSQSSDLQKVQEANSVKLNTPVACLSVGHTRTLEMKFSSNGQKMGLQLGARNSRHALKSNTLSVLPQIDETILLRGGRLTKFGPLKKKRGCFMHTMPDPITAKEISVGLVFRAIDTACQVRKDDKDDKVDRTIRVPHDQWEHLKHKQVCYGHPPHNKKKRHEKERNEWAKKAPHWSASIKATVIEALANWEELIDQ